MNKANSTERFPFLNSLTTTIILKRFLSVGLSDSLPTIESKQKFQTFVHVNVHVDVVDDVALAYVMLSIFYRLLTTTHVTCSSSSALQRFSISASASCCFSFHFSILLLQQHHDHHCFIFYIMNFFCCYHECLNVLIVVLVVVHKQLPIGHSKDKDW